MVLQWKISALKGTYLMYMSKVGIHYPCLVSFFFFFKQTRASWSEDMDYIEKNVHVRKFPLSLSEREGFEREFQEREGERER